MWIVSVGLCLLFVAAEAHHRRRDHSRGNSFELDSRDHSLEHDKDSYEHSNEHSHENSHEHREVVFSKKDNSLKTIPEDASSAFKVCVVPDSNAKLNLAAGKSIKIYGKIAKRNSAFGVVLKPRNDERNEGNVFFSTFLWEKNFHAQTIHDDHYEHVKGCNSTVGDHCHNANRIRPDKNFVFEIKVKKDMFKVFVNDKFLMTYPKYSDFKEIRSFKVCAATENKRNEEIQAVVIDD